MYSVALRMDGYPVLLNPEGTSRPIAFGSAGTICQVSCYPGEVVKAPLKHNVKGCSEDVIKSVQNEEYFSELCISREKLIYESLPKDLNILDCVAITERGLHFPYMRLGNLRDYLQSHNNQLDSHIRDQWIINATSAVAVVHCHDVVHADISARNFLVADDLSIKLCDFSGSGIGELEPFMEEEDRYRMSPYSVRSTKTDIFALGCLIFEVSTGLRPYDEIDDAHYEEIENRYTAQVFPCLNGLRYRNIIHKCWTSQYASVDQLIQDISCCIEEGNAGGDGSLFETGLGHRLIRLPSSFFMIPTLALFTVSSAILLLYRKQSRR